MYPAARSWTETHHLSSPLKKRRKAWKKKWLPKRRKKRKGHKMKTRSKKRL